MHKQIDILLREIKDRLDCSEPFLAAELGTSQPTINRILKGQKDCRISTFLAIQRLHDKTFKSRRQVSK